jgi:hypothetical protein
MPQGEQQAVREKTHREDKLCVFVEAASRDETIEERSDCGQVLGSLRHHVDSPASQSLT